MAEGCSVIALDITIAPTADPSQEMMTQHHRFNVSFAEAYATVAEEQPVICAATGIEYPAVLPPTIVLVDVSIALDPSFAPFLIEWLCR